MTQAPGALAHAPDHFDWEAYAHLQQRSQAALSWFQLAAAERALERLLECPHRASHGKKLALRLERDARKYLRQRRTVELLLEDVAAPG
jgi:hypothetical protein